MCSRFELNISKLDLLKRYNKKQITKFNPKTEVFPGQQILTFYDDFNYMRWGIDVDFMKKSIINSRIEKIYTSKFFKEDFECRRCLIPATAFFEWNQKNKDKYRLTVANQQIFSIAGIFSEYKSQETSIRHVSMLTTEAKGLIAEIHTRMPIILPQSFEQTYLHGENSKEIHEFLLDNFIDLDMENLSDSQLTFL